MVHQIRIYSGLILLLFVTFHLLNLTLGLVSFDVMNAARAITIQPWRTLPGTIILGGALLLHALMALWSLFNRHNFRLKAWEATQLILGLLLPLLMTSHVVAARGLFELKGVQFNYELEFLALWVFLPEFAVAQAIGLLAVWIHGCIGFHTWLRLKSWYAAFETYFFAFAILLPGIALASYVSTGVKVLGLAKDQKWIGTVFSQTKYIPEHTDWVFGITYWISGIWLAIIAVILIARAIRNAVLKKRKSVKLYYRHFRESQVFDIPPGWSVLEALRASGIRHASVCGGRGRCTTCRVKVGEGMEHLIQPNAAELSVLKRISAPGDVRLACQLHPLVSLEITPLLPATAGPADGLSGPGYVQGQERKVVIMFIDIRESTKLAEHRLPFDVVFILNQFFSEMADTLEDTGGHYAQFNGDGLMALYGLDCDLHEASVQALQGVQQMMRRLEILNERLSVELHQPLRMGIGLHCGDAIVGQMGPPKTPIITALGDNVNIAARLEAMTKEFGVQVVVSADTAAAADIDFSAYHRHDVDVRGRETQIGVYAVEDSKSIPVPVI